MPEFVKPFSGVVPDRKMTLNELVRALRLNLSAEEEATHLYTAHADATDNELAKRVLLDIANEERVHVGEFQRLISILLPDEDGWLADGAGEVNAHAAAVSGGMGGAQPQSGHGDSSVPTVGSLKGK